MQDRYSGYWWEGVPEHIQPSIRNYVEHGIPCGSFLTAVIENNLTNAISQADDVNAVSLREIVGWFYNDAPSNCWGNPEVRKAWEESHRSKRIEREEG